MLPNLIIIGGAKCGTTSLHYYLSLHPEICMSQPKELDFFVEEGNWRKGVSWYESKFDAPMKTIRGEASPHYTRYPIYRRVPERMHSVIPQAKLIYVLRDPMERLISQIVDDFSSLDLEQDLRAALLPFHTSPFVTPSLQCLQLEEFLSYYKLRQILLIDAKELAKKRSETLIKVFRFLGVDDTFTSKDFALMLNPRAVKRKPKLAFVMVKRFLALRPGRMIPYSLGLRVRHRLMEMSAPPLKAPAIDPEVEARLVELFRDDTLRLRRRTGLKLHDWCV